ncbi:MAG: glycosyltransferase [bacterium]
MNRKLAEGEAFFEKQQLEKARECFWEVLHDDPESVQAYNNLGVLAFHQKRYRDADRLFSRALEIDPGFDEASQNLGALSDACGPSSFTRFAPPRLAGLNIAVVNTFNNRFTTLWTDYFGLTNRVRVVKPNGYEDLLDLGAWADIVWSAWCNEPVIFLSLNKRAPLLISHIRSYEILTPEFTTKINWANIDQAIFVADHIRQIALEIIAPPFQSIPSAVVPNCIDLDNYPFYHKAPGHNVAYVGYVNHKKGISLLLQCIAAAIARDHRYRFHLAGDFQEKRFEVYVKHLITEMGLREHVIPHGWVDDIPAFLADMDYVISTSPWEGCPNNVIEAMACGVKPLVHNWRGARDLFGDDLVFNTVDEFMTLLTSPSYDSQSLRDQVSQKYNAATCLAQLESVILKAWEKKKVGV